MSGIDRLPMTNLRCLLDAPDGTRCEYRTDSEIRMEQHTNDHLGQGRGVTYDNCQKCGLPIRLTMSNVLRVHGRTNNRCPGSGYSGRFVLRCRGQLVDVEDQP